MRQPADMPLTEQVALDVLKTEGFEEIRWESLVNWTSPYDFVAIKEGVNYLVEVKSSVYKIDENRLRRLGRFKDPVLFLIIDGEEYSFIPLEKMMALITQRKNQPANNEKVYDTLKKAEDWMSIVQVAEKADLTRTTASKFLFILVAEGKAEMREMGPARMFRAVEG